MNQLYKKSELRFALLWILVYVLGTSLMRDERPDAAPGLLAGLTAFHLALSAVLVGWIVKNGHCEKYGLCAPRHPARRLLYYLPLLAIGTVNVWRGVALNYPPAATALRVVSMLCVGLLEELIFRGLLFKAMRPNGRRSAVIVSALTFALGHIVNLFNASGQALPETLVQIGYAAALGLMFVVLFERGGSLLPCILTHSLIDMLSVVGNGEGASAAYSLTISAILVAVALAYTAYIARTLPLPEE